jgi:hypothetical protein
VYFPVHRKTAHVHSTLTHSTAFALQSISDFQFILLIFITFWFLPITEMRQQMLQNQNSKYRNVVDIMHDTTVTYRNKIDVYVHMHRSQWPRGLRRGSAAARFLGLWVRIQPGAWMSVSCDCFVLSGRGLCDGLVTRPGESYRVWCVWVWLRSLKNEEALAR